MRNILRNRHDFFPYINRYRFFVRHYAVGYYPVDSNAFLTVNRLFFPLRNTNREYNIFADGEQTFELVPESLLFVPAFHTAHVRLDEKLFFLSIQFNMELFPGIDFFSDCHGIRRILHPKQLSRLEKLFRSNPESVPFAAIEMKNLVEELVFSLIREYPRESFQNVMMFEQFPKILDYLEHHASARTQVSDLAETVPETRESFTRHFTNATGFTPKQILDRFLIRRACDCLRDGCSIKETASLLGFSSEFVFSTFFKRITGEAPSFWKKRWGMGNDF